LSPLSLVDEGKSDGEGEEEDGNRDQGKTDGGGLE